MFLDVLKARIPVIGVTTDDYLNFPLSLSKWSGLSTKEFKPPVKSLTDSIYYTINEDDVSAEVYRFFNKEGVQLVVINPTKKSPLIFDAGELPTPVDMLRDYLASVMAPKDVAPALEVLKGLSLKATSEVVMLTQARTGSNSIKELRRTRSMLGGSVNGLIPVDTTFSLYVPPEKLEDWLKTNQTYFLSKTVHPALRPRGVMLEGHPGVGKSLAAKYIAQTYGVPLFRLDVATTLNRYIGESESRMARILSTLEREAPCVMLLDEVEKVFQRGEDSGVTTRLMAQLLWWLADHQAQVLTVMTTNNLDAIPPELYRNGRCDLVMRIPRLSVSGASSFGQSVLRKFVGDKLTSSQVNEILTAMKTCGKDEISHAEVTDIIHDLIKKKGWVKP